MAQEDVKGFLYAWLGKKKVTPDYNIRPTGGYQSRPEKQTLDLALQLTCVGLKSTLGFQ